MFGLKDKIEAAKQQRIKELAIDVKVLEKELIQANMDIADLQSRIEIEQGLLTKLKCERDIMDTLQLK